MYFYAIRYLNIVSSNILSLVIFPVYLELLKTRKHLFSEQSKFKTAI